MAVVLGDTEEDADHLHRQLGRQVDEEVERDPVFDPTDERAGAAPQLGLDPGDHAGGEAGAHESPDPRVARVVHHVEHDTCNLEILQERPAVPARTAALRRVRARVAQHGQRLGVGGHRPEPLAVRRVLGRLVPPHRRLASVDLEESVREAVREVVKVGEVDVGERGRACRHVENLQPCFRDDMQTVSSICDPQGVVW